MNLLPVDRTGRDLAWLTLAKLAVILLIYIALFAGYDGRPVDTTSHLLGPAPLHQKMR